MANSFFLFFARRTHGPPVFGEESVHFRDTEVGDPACRASGDIHCGNLPIGDPLQQRDGVVGT